MQIPKELLSEVNYEGTRLVEINNEKISEYKSLLNELQKKINPLVEEMDVVDKRVAPFRDQVKALKDENQKDYEAIKPFKEQYIILAKALPEDATDSTPEMKELEAHMNPFIDKIKAREVEISKIREEMKPHKDEWDKIHNEQVMPIEMEARVIKEKIVPLVNSELEGKLGEFEEAKHLVERDGKIYAEVFDLIEEFVKAHRAKKNDTVA
jgi:chromosome segregation ATPase